MKSSMSKNRELSDVERISAMRDGRHIRKYPGGRNGAQPFEDKFLKGVPSELGVDCWEWQGTMLRSGYGIIDASRNGLRTKHVLAHRASWLILRGPIPDNLMIDHLCRNRRCINPSHLELVTGKTNVLRGIGLTAINANKTECLKGHPFTAENTYIYKNRRICRICRRQIDKRHRDKKR